MLAIEDEEAGEVLRDELAGHPVADHRGALLVIGWKRHELAIRSVV
jgi:hypothetical protein